MSAPRASTITDEALRSIDLLQFNGGENPYRSDSVRRSFEQGADHYRAEIRRWGFSGHRRVLDLLCGHGRWSVFLAEANEEVVGLDKNPGAINIVRGLCARLGLDNARFIAGDVSETSGLEDDSFDAVWIWTGLIYVERGPCLDEVHRLLRPGGCVLIGGMNSTGRLLEKLLFGLRGNTPRHKAHRRQAIGALRAGPYFNGMPNYATVRTAPRILTRHSFETERIEIADRRIAGFFPGDIHVLARKPVTS